MIIQTHFLTYIPLFRGQTRTSTDVVQTTLQNSDKDWHFLLVGTDKLGQMLTFMLFAMINSDSTHGLLSNPAVTYYLKAEDYS